MASKRHKADTGLLGWSGPYGSGTDFSTSWSLAGQVRTVEYVLHRGHWFLRECSGSDHACDGDSDEVPVHVGAFRERLGDDAPQ